VLSYQDLARFYDDVMDDPAPRASRVQRFIDRHHAGASTLLELGCGTGSILVRLTTPVSLTGLDQSADMLAVASQKVPHARLVQGDMSAFSLGQRFDVVVCVFDSLNHLLTFSEWEATFDAVHDHLTDDGVFLFDVNTVGELRRLGEEPPWVYDFGENVMIMDVSRPDDTGVSLWHIQVFEHVGEDRYVLHEEQIGELGVPLSTLMTALEPKFVLLEAESDTGGPPSDDSMKAHFAYRRRP